MTALAAGLPPAAAGVVQLLVESQRPLIVFHEHPDGDALGSALALRVALARLGKQPVAACSDEPAEYYRFLPGCAEVAGADVAGDFDLAVLVDCADLDRAGALLGLARACRLMVNIDHHPTNGRYGDAALVVPEASASAELVAGIIRALAVPIDAAIATCIYTGILTDTGSFHYSNTTPACLALAGEMVAAGADPVAISEAVYEQRPRGDIELLAAGLRTLEVSEDGLIACLTVTSEDIRRTDGDSEGLVNYGRMIAGVEIALLFREDGPLDVKVSFRSRRLDVSAIAREFGGGGHPRAAGCTYRGPLAEARAAILRRATECVRQRG